MPTKGIACDYDFKEIRTKTWSFLSLLHNIKHTEKTEHYGIPHEKVRLIFLLFARFRHPQAINIASFD